MPLKTFATNDILSAPDLNNGPYSDAVQQAVGIGAVESTTATGYTDLSTAGPAVTLTVAAGQQVMIVIQCRLRNIAGGSGYEARMGFTISGANTLAASDSRAIKAQSDQNVFGCFIYWHTCAASGSITITAKYSVSASTGEYEGRWISAKKH